VRYFTRIRVYAVGYEKFNRALPEDFRPFEEMYSDLKRKEKHLPIALFYKRKWEEPSSSTTPDIGRETIFIKVYFICFV